MTGEYEKHAWPEELTLDDDAGPAAHISRAKADAMIASALLEAGFAPAPLAVPTQKNVSTVAPPPRRRSMLWQVAAACALAFVGMGSASAAVMLYKRIVASEPVVIEAPSQKPRAQKPRRPKPVEPQVEAVVEAPVVLDEVVVERDKSEKRKPARKPEDFLDDANRLRAEKRWRDADEAYARVWQAAPKSSAAYVARVAPAAVRL